MTARLLIAAAGLLVALAGSGVALTLAAIGDLDHETRPLAAVRAWAAGREVAVMGWWRAHRLPLLGLLYPQRGNHTTKEATGGQTVLDRHGVGDPAPAGVAAPADLPVLPGTGPVREDPLTTGDDYDTATLEVFRAVNAEHLVRPHEPPGLPAVPAHTGRGLGAVPGPDGLTRVLPPGAAAREASGPGNLAAINEWIERNRQQTVVDPVFGGWLAELLALDGMTNASYLQRMTAKLRAVSS